MARELASALGLEAVVSTGQVDSTAPSAIFRSCDLVVGFLPSAPAFLDGAALLPFLPVRGSLPQGPEVAWWLCAPAHPRLAASLAASLARARQDGGLARDIDRSLGTGAAQRYFDSIGFDGILRAQYLALNPSQRTWLARRRGEGGKLTAAVREGGMYAYVPQPDGHILGFDFDLVVTLANSLGLRLNLNVQKDVKSFFTHDGVMPADLGMRDYDYTPDLLKHVDVYANPMGVTPWRERLMKMITIYPIRNQLAGRKGEELKSIRDLDGKRFAVIKDSVQQKTLQEFAEKNNLHLSFVYDRSEDGLFRLVRAGKADYILDGSVIFALKSEEIRDFGLSPFFSELQGVAWAVKKDDEVFASIVQSFFNASRDSGLLPALWSKTFKMDFTAYIDAMTAAAETGAK
ncbi:MAG TPA: transporter substrate-binding domain-containing protein [Rectinemataceae bacterium]|nr:transporter substrate-binding domain-containing protein [Rectinemataceae bacterium]